MLEPLANMLRLLPNTPANDEIAPDRGFVVLPLVVVCCVEVPPPNDIILSSPFWRGTPCLRSRIYGCCSTHPCIRNLHVLPPRTSYQHSTRTGSPAGYN